MVKKLRKILIEFLVFATLITYLPLGVIAESIKTTPNQTTSQATAVEEKKEVTVVKELVEKRELNKKHFLMSDGTIVANIYSDNVHYNDKGTLKEIDNTLVSSETNYSIKGNSFNVDFAKTINSNRVLTMTSKGYTIGLFLSNSAKSNSKVKNNAEKTSNGLKTLTSFVNYNDVLLSTDLTYDILPTQIKESIVLKDSKALNNNFTFTLTTNGLLAKIENKNTIVVYDGKTKEEQFILSAPFMYDANMEYHDGITFLLTKVKDGYEIKMKLDMAWLKSKNRVYPIVIDPTIVTSRDFSQIDDTYIYNGDTYNTTKWNAHILRVGNNTYSYTALKPFRSLIKFTLPTIEAGDQIVDASLKLYNFEDTTAWNPPATSVQVAVHKMTANWTESGARWANLYTSFDPKVADYFTYQYTSATPRKENYLNITSIVKDWYVTGNNYGLMLKELVEGPVTGRNDISLLSADTSSAYYYYRPVATITYRNQTGIESYQTYTSQSVGRAGSGYINNYNGNMAFSISDLSTSGERLPVNINHTYNTNDRNLNIGFGNGYRLNLSQTLEFVTLSGLQYIKYIDEDGTRHYFSHNGTAYVDEDGLGLTITSLNDVYTMKDINGSKLIFVKYNTYYVLKEIVNTNGNKVVINYIDGKIVSVVDAASKTIALTYTNGILSRMSDSYGSFMNYFYTNNNLTSIQYTDGKNVYYTYDSLNMMTSATNVSNNKVKYEYSITLPNRAVAVYEYGTNGTLGNYIKLNYGNDHTSLVDRNNTTQNFVFNYYGQTISIADLGKSTNMNNAYGQAYKYINTSSANKNKLSLVTKLTGSVNNYIKNGNAENTLYDWSLLNEGSISGTMDIVSDSYYGTSSFRLVSTSKTATKVYGVQTDYYGLWKDKTYTLSAQVKTLNIDANPDGGAQLFIRYNNIAGQLVTLYSEKITGTKNWQKISLTALLPSGITNLKYGYTIKDASGTAYFDAVQIEDGTTANSFNLIENGNFYFGMANWIGNSLTSNDQITSLNNNYAMKISGGGWKNIYQTIKGSGKQGDTFNLSAWAKARSKPLYGGAALDIRINVVSTTGVSQWLNIPISPDTKEWQFISDEFVAAHDYKQIDIYLCYYYNVNEVYFDNIMLFKDAKSVNYTYDTKGNIVSVIDDSKNIQTLQYDSNNQLTKTSDPNGQVNSYIYDAVVQNRIVKTTDASGLSYNFQYDTFGNPIKSIINSINSTLSIETSVNYSADGNTKTSEVNAAGYMTKYTYNSRGQLVTLTDASGVNTDYTYDSLGRKITIKNGAMASTFTYENDRLIGLNSNNNQYKLLYDEFGNNTGISIGTQTLIANAYNSNGVLTTRSYGNGQSILYTNDNYNRISKVITQNNTYIYDYDFRGNIGYIKDNTSTQQFVYDSMERPVSYINSNGFTIDYLYNSKNGNSGKIYGLGEKINTNNISYDSYNRVSETANDQFKTKYNYDGLARLSYKELNNNNQTYMIKYSYLTNNLKTTFIQNELQYGNNKLSYKYNSNGNIEYIYENDIEINRYYYDSLNQLSKEDDKSQLLTIVYLYDNGGNITSKKYYEYQTEVFIKEVTYGYNTTWKDELVSYDNVAITYDNIGNPITYGNNTYSWINGKELSTFNNGSVSVKYIYNANGIRTSKTVNNVITNYYLEDSKVIYEKTNGTVLYYYYDEAGSVSGMEYQGNKYYFVKNLQNDIIGILDNNLTLVATYKYDSWGNPLSIKDASGNVITDSSNIANINPYRYRSYRYDSETGYYYLQSRYYNSTWGRFLNTDDFESLGLSTENTLSTNLFAYCLNNPVNLEDGDGKFGTPIQWAAAVIGAIGGWFFGDYIARQLGYKSGWKYWAVRTGVVIGSGVVGWFTGTAMLKIMTKFLLSNPVVMAKMPSVLTWFLGLGSGLGGVTNIINQITPDKMNHIRQLHHAWNLVNAFTDSAIKGVLTFVLENGKGTPYDAGNTMYTAIYNGQAVQVIVRVVKGIVVVVDAWVKTRG